MPIKPFTVPGVQHVHAYPDGTKAGFEVNIPFGNKPVPSLPRLQLQPKVDEKKLWTEFNALMKAVEKCGVLEMAADMSANNAKIEAAIKSALTRYG